ncbi:Miniconductance mechanosensitive channel YbdG [Planctomycetes bacterium Pla163]|uniref:Miniconductance mechanosensitive channel YbdG n=1 Tax=Rohdeia mirabilis TaxID=2528008 RepID=A0A518CVA1_9BACT|nr:Miniconductance mechanosensitive channel YbdG [Planctomycetes bacterium Pla163]
MMILIAETNWNALLENIALRTTSTWIGVALAAWLANLVTKKVIVRVVRAVIERSRFKWDDALVEHRVFERLSHLAPALVFHLAATFFLTAESQAGSADLVRRLASVWMILAGASAASAAVDALAGFAQQSPSLRDKPVRSYGQVVKIVLLLAVGILVVATLAGKSPWALLTGLGAMTAILLLVFKDTILGFVASVQLASNDMLRIGDWVEMPKFGADGDVVDISLNTVKVQNWDKTISTIPTYNFISEGVKNWRGMSESGGRRIKRSIALDMTSVAFLTEEDLERLRQIKFLTEYLERKAVEVKAWNSERGVDDSVLVNGRRLTNLGTFRAYLELYLKDHPHIREDMTFLVRQLPPAPAGSRRHPDRDLRLQRGATLGGVRGHRRRHLRPRARGDPGVRVACLPEAGRQ